MTSTIDCETPKKRRRGKRKKHEYYIPFFDDEDEDLSFTTDEVKQVMEGWEEGDCYVCIADRLKRDEDFVFVLMIDLGRKGVLAKRTHGYYGYCRGKCRDKKKEKGSGKWKIEI